MPLTLPTHPVGVVPLKLWRPRWFDGVALVIGAIAPDIAYAAYGIGPVLRTHNLPALLWWSLPVTLAGTRVVRWAAPVVAAHLPGGRDLGALGGVRHRWFVTVVSALIGAGSHVAWDVFTHPAAWLRGEVWPGMPWWGLLSDGSNVIGFVAGGVLVWRVWRRGLIREWHGAPPRIGRRPVVFWGVVALVSLGGSALVLLFPTDWGAAQAIRIMLAGGLALVCGAAAAWPRRIIRSSPPTTGDTTATAPRAAAPSLVFRKPTAAGPKRRRSRRTCR